MDRRGLNYASKDYKQKNRRNAQRSTKEIVEKLEMRVPNLTLDDVRLMIDKNWVKECELEELTTP
jgi:hypothetical protein